MASKFYSVRFEIPSHHAKWPDVIAFLSYLKKAGIDSEVNTVTVSTPPAPRDYFISDEVVVALEALGPSKTSVLASHLGWDTKRVGSHLNHLRRRGIVLHAGRCFWALAPREDAPRVVADQEDLRPAEVES